MKKVISVLFAAVFGAVSFVDAQSTVTINTTGNRNKQVLIDNKTYTIDNTTATEENTVVITDLASGQHSLELVRNNASNRKVSTKTTFTVRDGYDLTITVTSNGAVSTTENRTARGNNGLRGQLTTAAFNKLLTQTRSKTSSSTRATFLETEFTSLRKKMTASQARQLIQLVNSESLRLKLAKQSYPLISDPANFSQVSTLLSSSINRNELNNYIASLPDDSDNDDIADNTTGPMTTARFTTIYNEVVSEPTAAEKTYYLNNFFSREGNTYTSAQVRQLVELVPNEQDRLTLAKAAYHGVTDRGNYTSAMSVILSSSYSRSDLTSYVNNYGNSNSVSGTAMADVDFTKLYNNVNNTLNSTTRFNLVAGAVNPSTNKFTTYQVRRLLTLISSENNKLTLAKNSYDNIVDKQNFSLVYDLFPTASYRNDLVNFINNTGSGTDYTVKTPMTDTDFNTLYRRIQMTFGLGAKYNSLTEVFNTETNYFNVDQAKRLIQLVSSESNRVELAKLSYNNITDVNNFSNLYDIFSSQSAKNEVMAYVSSSAYNN